MRLTISSCNQYKIQNRNESNVEWHSLYKYFMNCGGKKEIQGGKKITCMSETILWGIKNY